MKRRFVAILLTVMLLVTCTVTAMAEAPGIRKVEYEGNGVVEVDFSSDNVKYKNAKVVVKDSSGKKLSATILEKDSDDIVFKVKGLKSDSKYAFAISGVRKGSSGSYGTVTGSFRTPSGSLEIKKVKYDAGDRELEVEFTTKVQFKNLKVTVVDSNGNKLSVKNVKKGSDDVEMKVAGMERGKRYKVTVSGVRVKGKGSYTSISKVFTA